MRVYSDAGLDPTELHWFDVTGSVVNRSEVDSTPLTTYRPPFDKCMVVFKGAARNGVPISMFMLVTGSDPTDGIVLTVWRIPGPGQKPVKSPDIVYLVADNGNVQFGPLDENETIAEDEASMVLGFAAAWYAGLAHQRCEAYVPFVPRTFTNQRKITAGKTPSYDWRTVIIEPTPPKKVHQGGTHASPRQHDRRGHVRRLQSGKNVWVKPCKVGDASKGAVFHDYLIRSADSPGEH